MKYNFNELEKWQKIGIVCLLVVIPGIVGWLVEFFFGWFDNGMKDVYWKGGNFLPWINMYPIGSFLIIACTYKFRDKPLKVLIMSVLASTIFELVTGFVLDKVFNAKSLVQANKSKHILKGCDSKGDFKIKVLRILSFDNITI